MKRAFDFVAALFLLILCSPILAVTAAAIAVRIGRPVLFRQLRPGLHARPFTLIKFRTMTSATGPDGQLLGDSVRLTPLGRQLRAWSVDELPELWNVIRGEMSLVGPRPLLMEYLPLYSATQARRHDVRPGLTGWAQIHGRNQQTWESRLEMDVWYVDNQSLALDLTILLKTLSKVLQREGITQSGSATMDKFKGQR